MEYFIPNFQRIETKSQNAIILISFSTFMIISSLLKKQRLFYFGSLLNLNDAKK